MAAASFVTFWTLPLAVGATKETPAACFGFQRGDQAIDAIPGLDEQDRAVLKRWTHLDLRLVTGQKPPVWQDVWRLDELKSLIVDAKILKNTPEAFRATPTIQEWQP